jgi:hypothetical protein
MSSREVTVHGIYRHFKGKYYIVEGIANNSETNEPMVVYRHLYGDRSLCVRPMDMFLSEVDHEKYPDVEQQYRFELVDEYGLIAKPPEEEYEPGKIIKNATFISLVDWLIMYFYMFEDRSCNDGEFTEQIKYLADFRKHFMHIAWARFDMNISLNYGPIHLQQLPKQTFDVDLDSGYVTCNLSREQMQCFVNRIPDVAIEIAIDALHVAKQMRLLNVERIVNEQC